MPSSSESVSSPVNASLGLEEEQIILFSDTISGIKKTIEGLAQLAGLEGLDSVAEKLQEAVEECENWPAKELGESDGLYQTGDV